MKSAIIGCIVCKRALIRKQTKFCSTTCKGRFTNNKFQNYKSQKERGTKRKEDLIRMKGGKCEICGYNKNISALCFHHRDPDFKLFQLDLKTLSNRTLESILVEAEKCTLLCSNCHAELHNPIH